MKNANMLDNLLVNLTAFAANGNGSPEQINAFGFEIRGLEQGARIATVKLAIGCLRRYANGDKQKFFASGEDQRLKNYYSVFNGLVGEGYAPATQLAWFDQIESNFSAVYGQSKKAAIATLQEAGILEKPAPAAGAPAAGAPAAGAPAAGAPAAGAPAAGAPAAGAVSAALSDADRAGKIAAETVGLMSPEVFDLLAAAVARHLASNTAAQKRREAAEAKQKRAAENAARIGELRRAANAADTVADAAEEAANLPGASAATKRRAAKLHKAAREAGAAYQAAVDAARQEAIAA